MKTENQRIWSAGAFTGKRNRLRKASGRAYVRWHGIVAQVEALLIDRNDLVILVSAAGDNPRNPSEHDITHAQVASLIVMKQQQFSAYKKRTRTYLTYTSGCRVEVDCDLRRTEIELRKTLGDRKDKQPEVPMPSPLMSFFINRRWRS